MRFLRILICICVLACPAMAKPNFVLILVDDFSMNLMPRPGLGNMPQLAKMMREGMTFDNYFVTDSLCCPSRASILTGLLPHHTGVLTNVPPFGGQEAFTAHGNEAKVFALPLQAAGYNLAYMGKYLNGWMTATSPIPPGWQEWASTENGYQGYGYTLNHNGVMSTPPDHFTDLISGMAKRWITWQRLPFFLELAPFSPHGPYVPARRHRALFLNAKLPRTLAYDARPDAAAPDWLQVIPALTSTLKIDLDRQYVLRLQASESIDEMIGAVRSKLESIGIADKTYVIFTNDNGYHMGEFSMRSGKQTPFDFDIKVPFVIVGPGIVPGSHSKRLTMSVDLYPTLLNLAQVQVPAMTDGRPMFSGPGRTMAVVEHHREPSIPDDPDFAGTNAPGPPTYTALRMAGSMYVEYETGEVGYYDMTTDPHQLHNVVASLSRARKAQLHAAVVANSTCAGGAECGAAQNR
jgi:N-acetylglucosamine-6-sulfatase